MRKNIFLAALIVIVCGTQHLYARSNPVQIHCFEANGVMIYDVKGCVPQSDISFYSRKDGGAILKQLSVDASGHTQVVWNDKGVPAFVLNIPSQNSAGIAGNGMVSFTGDKEFTINDMAIENNSGTITLRWNASVNLPEQYKFQVLKNVNGSVYSTIQTESARSISMIPYAFIDPAQYTEATYEIRVVNSKNEVFYTSTPFYTDGTSAISVYPTIVHTSITVRLNNNAGTGDYKIVDMKGQVVTSGSLSNAQSNCSVASLPPGNYLIEVSSAGKKTATKFVKE